MTINVLKSCSTFQVIPIGEPIPAISADYTEQGEDRLFNIFGGGRPNKPSFNLFGGNKGNKGGGSRPSYKAPGSNRPKPSYGAPKPSYSAPKPSYSAPKPSYGAPAVNNARLVYWELIIRMSTALQNNFSGPHPAAMVCLKPPLLAMVSFR